MRFIRRTALVLALTIMPFALAACGSTPAPRTPSTSSNAPAESAPAPAPAPDAKRTVTDANGNQVEVPANPERVVALSEPDLDAMLALGMKPIGTISGRGQTSTPRYLGDRPAGIPIVGTVSQPTMDQVIALEPDLILTGSLADPQILSQLTAIAPTVSTLKAMGEDWKTHFGRVATTLNKEAEVQAWFANYDKKVAEIRAALGPNANAEVSVVRWNPAGPIYMSQDLFTSQVLAEVGLKRPAHQKELNGQSHSPTLSLELLSQIDGDWLFLGTLNPDGDAAMQTAMATPAFQQLKVVKNQRVVQVDGTMWSSGMGPLAAMGILETVAKEMAAQ